MRVCRRACVVGVSEVVFAVLDGTADAQPANQYEAGSGRADVETRRELLAASAGTLAALAGCAGGATESSDDSVTTNTGASADRATAAFDGHPATRGLDAQPRLGPPAADAPALIVGYEDPSCSSCRRFERNTLPEIVERLVQPGRAAFVFRGYPVVYEWGKPATQALEATFAASESAFWALKDYYYAEQAQFETDNVLAKTESFLASETDVDAGTVVEDARNRRYDAAVRADTASAEAAGANGVTPSFYLFRDGEFKTKVAGPQGYPVFAAALGYL